VARTLVTGASGFIGRALCASLRAHGHVAEPLSRRDGDIADPRTLTRIEAAQHVFHLAGRTCVPESWNDPVGFHATNTLGTINVLDYCRRHRARLTFVSAYVYGVPAQLPTPETCEPRPNNPYALSKYLAEQECEFYAFHHGLDVTILRPFNVFGPGQRPEFLIPHVLDQIQERRPIHVNDLAPRRDYLYIDDVVTALLRTLDGPRGCLVINVGSGASMSVAEIIATMQSVCGSDQPVVTANEVRPQEIPDACADIRKAQRLLGWTPHHSFAMGIELMLFARSQP
jgi:GDP-4-dehydro-6-deoxy-D-mannose reductase